MTSRWVRLGFLTGAIGIAVILLAFIAVGGSTPSVSDSGDKILRFYKQHRDRQMLAGLVLALGAMILLVYVAMLRWTLALAPARGRLATVAFGAGVIAVGGLLFMAAIHVALADSAKYVGPDTIRGLAALDNDSYVPMAAGIGAMVLAAGGSLVRTRLLPLWVGIVAIIAGVATFTPAGFFAVLLGALWIFVTSIWFAARPPAAPETATPAT
jgi:hypothetical protein